MFTNKKDLYDEYYGVTSGGDGSDRQETDTERQERLMMRQKNRDVFDGYLKANVADLLDQALLMTTDVLDTRAFNPHTHRPMISRLGNIAALMALGVTEQNACNMAESVSRFPAPREHVRSRVCRHTCDCGQHELQDGTRIRGFLPRNQTVGLKVAPWSEWRHAHKRCGNRNGKGSEYIMNKCNRCWLRRNEIHQASNDKRQRRREALREELKSHTPQVGFVHSCVCGCDCFVYALLMCLSDNSTCMQL